jgi:hypothetical protein
MRPLLYGGTLDGPMKCLRPLLPAPLALALLCSCQRHYEVFGSVIDATANAPLDDASVFIADRIIDAEFDAFLKAPSAAGPRTGTTGKTSPTGEFRALVPIAGPAGHSVWIVVMKPGFFEHHEEVWTGVGYPDQRTSAMVIRVKPVAGTK